MPKVATFCPRCGESIETDVPEEAKAAGRAEIDCPACKTSFQIAPAKPRGPPGPSGTSGVSDSTGASGASASGPDPAQGGVAAAADSLRAQQAPAPGDAAWSPGAPRSSGASSQRTMKPVIAAFLLLMAATTWGWMGYELLTAPDIVEQGLAAIGGNGTYAGIVIDAAGAPIANATVRIAESPEGSTIAQTSSSTDSNGSYTFESVPSGIYVFTYSAEGHGNHSRTVPIYSSEWDRFTAEVGVGDVTLPPAGESTDDDIVHRAESSIRIFGYVFLAFAGITAAGCYAAFQRRWFPLAIIGGIGAVLAVFVPPVALGGIGALVLLYLARGEFARASL